MTFAAPRIACIGAGYWGRNLVRNFGELGALASVCDADASTRTAIAERYPHVRCTGSVDEVLADREVAGVVIATPAETHGRLVRRALEAGKDVLVEKPLCFEVEEGTELVALAERSGRILMVGHLLWYHPAVLKLRDLVVAGELGRIQYIYSNRLNLGRIRREENILWSFAPHDVSVTLGLLSEMPEAVLAQGGNYLHQKIADVTVTLLSFPSGIKAHIFVSWLHPFKEQKLIVVGDRKMAVFDDLQPTHKLVLYPHVIDWKDHVPVPTQAAAEPVAVERAEPLRAECAHFLDCIATRERPRTDGHEALRVLTVLQQCEDALQQPSGARVSKPKNGHKPTSAGETPGYFAHESAFIDPGVVIGPGTSIWHVSHVMKGSRIGKECRIGQNVVIGPNATIGDGVKIQNNVSVYQGVTLEDHVFCGPSMVFTNVYNPRSEIRRMDELRTTLVRCGATLGANCTIVCGVTIGSYAFVAAGAVVTKDVPDHALVLGNPGRVGGWMCVCGNRLHFDAAGDRGTCRVCSQRYRKAQEKVWPE
jgi:UDP-2-acetamido-3-amino-2,3-dideoxy-glucuronate N-acetyltransferase